MELGKSVKDELSRSVWRGVYGSIRWSGRKPIDAKALRVLERPVELISIRIDGIR